MVYFLLEIYLCFNVNIWTALQSLNDSKNISSCEKIGNYSVCKYQLLVYLAFSVSLMGFIP